MGSHFARVQLDLFHELKKVIFLFVSTHSITVIIMLSLEWGDSITVCGFGMLFFTFPLHPTIQVQCLCSEFSTRLAEVDRQGGGVVA